MAARPADGRYDDIAFDATLRAAALRQAPMRPGHGSTSRSAICTARSGPARPAT
ncbi:MAG: hypothetical protein U0470_04600 [Anaerolineae bacterium]